MKPCVDLAHELGIHAIVSVFSVELVEVAETLPWDAYKTASPDIINRPLLDAGEDRQAADREHGGEHDRGSEENRC